MRRRLRACDSRAVEPGLDVAERVDLGAAVPGVLRATAGQLVDLRAALEHVRPVVAEELVVPGVAVDLRPSSSPPCRMLRHRRPPRSSSRAQEATGPIPPGLVVAQASVDVVLPGPAVPVVVDPRPEVDGVVVRVAVDGPPRSSGRRRPREGMRVSETDGTNGPLVDDGTVDLLRQQETWASPPESLESDVLARALRRERDHQGPPRAPTLTCAPGRRRVGAGSVLRPAGRRCRPAHRPRAGTEPRGRPRAHGAGAGSGGDGRAPGDSLPESRSSSRSKGSVRHLRAATTRSG